MFWWESVMFLADGRNGWQELFYQQAGTLTQALQALQGLAFARASLTSSAVGIWKLRVSRMGTPRLSWDSPGLTGRGGSPALTATEGLMVRLAAGSRGLHRREYHIRGLPADFFRDPQTIAPQYQPALAGFLNTLSSGQWYMKVNALLSAEVPIQQLGAWTLDNGNLLGIPIAGQPVLEGGTLFYALTGYQPVAAATRVRIRGVKVMPAIPENRRAVNGVFPIVWQDQTGVYWRGGVATFTALGGGLVQLEGDTFEPIEETTVRKRASRKTGPSPKGFGLGQSTPATSIAATLSPPPAAPPISLFQRRAQWIWDTDRALSNMQDAVKFCFEGYSLTPDGKLLPIAIAPLVDYPHTWLVSVAGVNREAENDQTIWNGFLSGLNTNHAYRDDCENAVGQEIPAGDTILWHGHSMGGIVGQNLAADEGFTASWPIIAVITWGSPTTAPQAPNTTYFRFSEPEDLVSIDVGALLTLKGRKQFQQLLCEPSSPEITKFQQHNDYDKSPTLLNVKPWAGLASGAPGDVLRLGPITRYPAPD